MCLAIPGKVVEIYEINGVSMGKVDFDGIKKDICLAYVPEIGVGDYALVHVGFAISKVDEEEAQKTLQFFRDMDGLFEELGEKQRQS